MGFGSSPSGIQIFIIIAGVLDSQCILTSVLHLVLACMFIVPARVDYMWPWISAGRCFQQMHSFTYHSMLASPFFFFVSPDLEYLCSYLMVSCWFLKCLLAGWLFRLKGICSSQIYLSTCIFLNFLPELNAFNQLHYICCWT